jgi:acyl-coenzyme A thioesterase PaaI-like protein
MLEWPAPDWRPIQPFPFTSARGAFAGLTTEEGRIELTYFLRPQDKTLVAIVNFGPRAQGAPGLVHGGMILTVLDEALGAACWADGKPALTVQLNTRFSRSIPVNSRMLVETEITRVRNRLIFVRGVIRGTDNSIYAETEGRFMRLSAEALRQKFGQALSPQA